MPEKQKYANILKLKKLDKQPGRIPGSERVISGGRLMHRGAVVLSGNRPGSKRYVGTLQQDDGWRDGLIEAIIQEIVADRESGSGKKRPFGFKDEINRDSKGNPIGGDKDRKKRPFGFKDEINRDPKGNPIRDKDRKNPFIKH